MTELLIISEAEVKRLLDLDALLDALGEAFKAISSGNTSVPPRITAPAVAPGYLLAMPGYVRGTGLGAKVAAIYPQNGDRGERTHLAMIALFDEHDGTPLAVMDGSYISAYRTAMASALSARLLARAGAEILAIVGAGEQGYAHLEALSHVRQFREVRVASRTFAHAQALAATDPRARAVGSFEEAARGAGVICLCTRTTVPVVRYEWLSPGTHVISVGQWELDPTTVEQGQLFVETRDAFQPLPAGCPELEHIDSERGSELGEVLLGVRPGRRADDEVTVYKSVGHASEDVAAAALVYRRAREAGIGTVVTV